MSRLNTSARRFPIVVRGNSAFVPGPTNFLIRESDLFAFGQLHGEFRARVGHAKIDGADVRVRQANREMLPLDSGLVGRVKLKLEGGDIFVEDENAVEKWRGAIQKFGKDKRFVRAFARRPTTGWITRTRDFVHDRDDLNTAFATSLGNRTQNGALSLRDNLEVRVQGHWIRDSRTGGRKSLVFFDHCDNGKTRRSTKKNSFFRKTP